MKSQVLSLCGILFAGCLAACQSSAVAPTASQPPAETASLPNPASVYCEEQGGQLEMRADESGAVAGVCVFTDGSECDEWAYFRGECRPGDSLLPPTAYPAPEQNQPTADGWQTYHDDALGLSFDYPPDTTLEVDPASPTNLTISGPLDDAGERWPQITLSFPTDREDYRPPADADLLTWLTDHNLLSDPRADDVQIAGTTAIHLRHDRSDQSYAYDRYFFAHAGQLYMLVIGHTGDREDWELYDRFLGSVRFE